MKLLQRRKLSLTIQALTGAMLAGSFAMPVLAQDRAGDDTTRLEAVEVTGSRIKKAEIEGQTPVMTLTAADLQATGLGSVGDILQRLSVSGSSLNTKFNSAGNFGFPADGGGVGSGSTTVSLRNLGAKRVLVLVDGLRWVNESSASGVAAAVDLNTLPASAVDRIEILTDGASSLYGSDAIGGVINIITKRKQDGVGVGLYYGNYSTGDGKTVSGNASFGASTDRMDIFLDVSHFDQNRISSNEETQSRFPVPGTGVALGSSATPTGRLIFTDPNTGASFNITPNGSGTQVYDPTQTGCNRTDSYHCFTGADRFNFSPFNLLLTPSERNGLFGQARYKVTDNVNFYVKGVYSRRESVNQAAPEPIFLGPAAGSGGLADGVSIDVTNPFNPFGFTLDASTNMAFVTRRPIEGGPRIFTQEVDTRYLATGLEGSFNVGDHDFFWDVNYVDSTNKANQTVTGTYNIRHIATALGPISQCVAPCVPLNIFGGPGTITQEMLNYIQFTENDRSENQIEMVTANLSGDIVEMPAGALSFATGLEHRHLEGFYTPDAVVIAGDTNGVPSLPTRGDYSVDEVYLELNVPLLKDVAAAKSLELSLATRYSDYSTFGGTTNSKLGVRWQPADEITVRGTWAEGFRAPSIGELFGSPARFDATITDPCNGATGTTGANCTTLGVPNPATFEQSNTQISVRTGGSSILQPETSRSLTAGVVYSPNWGENAGWSDKLDFELTYFRHKIEDAIQAPDAQTQLDRCVATLDPAFCTGITRSSTGDINGFDNTLRNLGRIDTRGWDIGINWVGPETGIGRFGARWQSTFTDKFESIASDTGLPEPRDVGVEVNDSGIPEWRSTVNLTWSLESWSAVWTLRYISDLEESCNEDLIDLGVCGDPARNRNHLGSTTYHDARINWKVPTEFDFTLSAGINNILDKDPPVCITCSLNGYDASTYDMYGRFGYVQANIRF